MDKIIDDAMQEVLKFGELAKEKDVPSVVISYGRIRNIIENALLQGLTEYGEDAAKMAIKNFERYKPY